MAYEFRDVARIGFILDRVFSIACDKAEKRSPVRLEASRQYVTDM